MHQLLIFETSIPWELGRISHSSGDIQALVKHTLNLARSDVVANSLRAPSVNLAPSAEGSSEDLLYTTLERLGERLVLHLAGDLNDLVERDGLGVLDVLLLLAVARRLLEGLDDER